MSANTIISIKRSQSTNEPPFLANGELAYSYSSNKLFIGKTDTSGSPVTVEYIGGRLLVDKVANLESIVGGSGSTTFNNITVSGNATIQQIIFSSYSNNAILFSGSDGIVNFVTGSSGKILQISANGVPIFDDLNGGLF
jgi:hypothetical protein